MKCASCGLESKWEELFRAAPMSSSRKTGLLCPVCWQERENKVNKRLFWGSFAFVLPGLLLALAFPNLTVGALLLNFSAVQVLTFLSTVVHELGHALGAVV